MTTFCIAFFESYLSTLCSFDPFYKIKALNLFGMVQNSLNAQKETIPLSTVIDKFEDQYSISQKSNRDYVLAEEEYIILFLKSL
jgi:hypothetical protein